MERFERKSQVFLFLIVLIFLVAVSTAVSNVRARADSPSDDSFRFLQGTTVESLQTELSRRQSDWSLTVFCSDGTQRESGTIQDGDFMEIVDGDGNLLKLVTAVISSSADDLTDLFGPVAEPPSQPSSQAPPTSSQPSSSDSEMPSSSQPSESDPSSDPTSSSAPVSSGPASSSGSPHSAPSQSSGDYIYSEPVTVESLKAQIADKTESEGCVLDVTEPDGQKRMAGFLCTGDMVRVVMPDGTAQSSVRAIVLGDLTRSGSPTVQSGALLYAYLTGQKELDGDLLEAADLDRSGQVDTSDLLLLKKRIPQGE